MAYSRRLIVTVGIIIMFLASFFAQGEDQTLPREDYFNKSMEQKPFDAKAWKGLTKDFDYTEDGAVKESSTHRKANTRGEGQDEEETTSSSTSVNPFWAAVMKWLIVIMAIAILAVLLYHVIGSGSLFRPQGQKVKHRDEGVISIEAIEANIHESNIDQHIQTAIEQQNYAMAIRLYYLAIIKELSLNKLIKWKREKTNRDYLREMRPNNLFKPYRDLTRIFERVWYGAAILQESDFNVLKPQFVELLAQIRK